MKSDRTRAKGEQGSKEWSEEFKKEETQWVPSTTMMAVVGLQ